jgi:3-oxoadipate CoA-transferase, beta subunit
MSEPLTRDQIAQRVARDIPVGAFVNLGIGMPTKVSDYLEAERRVTLHTENGMLGMGPEAHGGEIDLDLINAGKIPVTELPGAAYFHHADSFAMMRGGHLDLCVLGAFQVADNGDIANWATSENDTAPAVGGAMDLAAGAKRLWVVMEHTTKDGRPKIVERCGYPLTGLGCVNRVYTNLAVLDVVPGKGFVVRDLAPGWSLAEVQAKSAATLHTN